MSWLTRLRDLLSGPVSIDVSIFCDATGITLIQSDSTTHHVAWPDIKHLIAYKKDLRSFQQVRLILGTATFATEVTENDPGFEDLVAAIREHLPTSMPGWHQKLIASPHSETSPIHVYPVESQP